MPPTTHLPTLLLACAFSISALSGPAEAQTDRKQVSIGGSSIELTLPEGHCAMSRDDDRDRRVIELVEGATGGANEVVLAFADCDHLTAWRNGERRTLGDFGQFQTLVKAKNQNLKGAEAQLVKQICDQFRSQGEGLFQGAADEVNKNLKSMATTMTTNEMKFLGIYSESTRQCTTSFIQKATTEGGASKTLYGINTNMILNGKIVYFNFYTTYENEETLATIRRKHAAALEALLAGN